jgi:hypothetical protein
VVNKVLDLKSPLLELWQRKSKDIKPTSREAFWRVLWPKELAEGRIGSLTRVKSNRHQLELVWGSRIDWSVKSNSCGFARATGHSRDSWTSTRVEDQCKTTIKFEGVSGNSCEDDGGRSTCQEGSEFHW